MNIRFLYIRWQFTDVTVAHFAISQKEMEDAMHDKQELCNKIVEMYPEIGQCEIDIMVDWNDNKNAWVVDLKKDNHELKHYLEKPDADNCMENKQCVSLGLEIGQLIKNVKGEQY